MLEYETAKFPAANRQNSSTSEADSPRSGLESCSVEPFRVTCETCRARLKVRDASAIGEIHACPKCGSMVQIAPPQGWSAETAPIAAAAVLAIADAPQPDFTHVSPPSDDVADMFERAAAAALAPHAAEPPAAVEFVGESPAPQAAQVAAGSPFVLWSVVSAAVILIGGLTVAFWPDGDAPSEPEAVPVAAAASSTSPTPVQDESAPVANEQNIDLSTEPHVVAKPTPDETTLAASESVPALPELPSENVADSNATDDDDPEIQQEPLEENAAPAASSSVANNNPPSPAVLKFDPLDFDPSQFSIGTSTSTNPATTSVPEEPTGEPDSNFGEAGRSTAGTAAESPRADASGILPAEGSPTITVRLGPIADAAQQYDVASQLALKVESLEFTSMPLARFVETLSGLSGLPITLDPSALELAGRSALGEIDVSARDSTLAALIEDALRKSRLTFVEKGGQVVVALPDADRRSSRDFDFSDLMEAGATDAAGVAQLIEAFVAPQSWKSAGGASSLEVNGNKLRIDQRKAAHHEMLLFCERLRLARGLAPKSKYPSELLTIDLPYSKVNAKLSQKTTFTFLPWTPLADVLRHWQESSGITMLVDWHRIADLELGPSTPLACSAIDRTWKEVLDEVLEPLGLAWWAVDGATIHITSRESLDDIQRVEFYEIPKQVRDQFASGSALVETLRTELGEQVGPEAADAEQLTMRLDKPSRRLIVRGTPSVHRYLVTRLGASN
jgi:hypothetical protein